MVSFGRDLIAEKNRRDDMKSSIVKYWNVNYIDTRAQKRAEEEAKLHEAMKIYERLEREKEEDEEKKQAEINQAYIEAEINDIVRAVGGTYNATTGSYSGEYGRGEVDDVTRSQIDLILNEKKSAIQQIVDGNV